ncbi:IS66 family insertion sequence element accessory protein TnpA [Thauera aromatica]|uniref:IS66 family insertion sequence element accessory protein TnpA n=1 Tax=Thauera aromatica TaxID=59405 RepID=UPI003CD0D19E
MREHVERWRRSGQTQAAYSAEHGVSKKSLALSSPSTKAHASVAACCMWPR